MIKKLKAHLFNTDIPMQNVLFRLLIAGAIVGGMIMELLTILFRSDINRAAEAGILIYLSVLLWYCLKMRKNLQVMITVVCVSAAFLIFPLFFLSNGGVNGGMPIWMVLALVLEIMLLERRFLVILVPVTISAYGLVFWLANRHSELVVSFKTEVIASTDIFVSLLAVAGIIGMIVRIQVRFYTNKCEQLEQAVREVERSNQAERRFLANMSHEIRTPVSAICGMDEMILRECNDTRIVSYANEIEVASKLLLSTINDILDFSKIESGNMELQIVEYRLSSLILDIYHLMELKMKEKNLIFQVEVNPDLPDRLYGDDVRLRQILLNIVNNAYKYTKKGFVVVTCDGSVTEDEVTLKFEVKDTGEGIKEEDIHRLFSEYTRVDELKNRNVEGSGLGMNIAMQLLVMMDSKLQVDSIYGKGSSFFFTIRQKVAGHEPIGKFQHILRSSVSDHRYQEMFRAPEASILVVDDNETNRRVFVKLLERTCVQIDEADSGKTCLDLIQTKKYDVIFMDHMMPEMDGIETFRRIRQGESVCRDVPVVILTANATLEHRDIYEKEGFTDYLRKPVDPERLEYLILKLLDKDKITYVSEELGGKVETTPQKEVALPEIEGILWNKALENIHSKETLYSMAGVFYRTLAGERTAIASLYERIEDAAGLKNYKIRVHGLKSAAAYIGAMQLSDMARSLEEAAVQGKLEQIRTLHPMLLREIEALEGRMSVMFPEEGRKQWEEKIDLRVMLSMLCEAMRRDDIDEADRIVKELRRHSYEDGISSRMEELFVMVGNLEEQRVNEIAAQIIEKIDALQIK